MLPGNRLTVVYNDPYLNSCKLQDFMEPLYLYLLLFIIFVLPPTAPKYQTIL